MPPDEYNADFESASLKPEDYSDIGQAKVLVREYGNELKYTSATDFLRFDGECWREDKQMAIGAVEEFLDLQLQDAMDEVARVEKGFGGCRCTKESIQAGPKELLKEVDGKLIPFGLYADGSPDLFEICAEETRLQIYRVCSKYGKADDCYLRV